ncbi:MAG: hypothetical protein NDJ90_09300 [Oligoflexia bacterium]|nr:hypothetical protein [Oligoflexia bacterium]
MKSNYSMGIYMSLWAFCLYLAPAAAAGAGDQPDPAIAKAQAELSQALGARLTPLRSGSSGTPAAVSEEAAEDRLSRALYRKYEEENDLLYNKAYLSDGRVIPASEWRDDMPIEEGPADPEERALGGSTSTRSTGTARPEWVLDGSNVPREMVFPGKPAPSPQPAKSKR